ncbi:MAG: DUF2889 domain-containing protein [Desulfobacterales bacterium]|nr:MAG: DUF2889 domain-containing protein [Desulfobacterales bacterium]
MNVRRDSRSEERLICNRKKNVDVFLLPSGKQFRAVAEMQDGVHHMRISMIVNQPSLRITAIECEMPGVPDPVCSKARNCLQAMIGKRVLPGLARELKNEAHQSCTHLLNLFHEACYNLTLAQSIFGKEELNTLFPNITEEQVFNIFLWFRPELEGSCVRYAANSPFMQKVSAVPMPPGAEKLKAVAQKKPRDRKLAN